MNFSAVHEIVTQRYKGKIKVDSTLGKGTTFTVTLPLDDSADSLRETNAAR